MRRYIVICDHKGQTEFQYGLSTIPGIEVVFITDQNSLDLYGMNQDDLIFIHAELQWEKDNDSVFEGFKIIEKIRVIKKWLNPIIICSYFPKHFFETQNTDNLFKVFKVLELPHSHSFVQLPFEDEINHIEKICEKTPQPLTENQRIEIQEYCLNPQGIFNETWHKFKDQIMMKGQIAIEECFQYLQSMIRQNMNAQFEQLKQELMVLCAEKSTHAYTFVNDYKTKLLKLTHFVSIEQPNHFLVPWQVLFVDDNELIRDRVTKELGLRGISCLAVDNAQEAFGLLEKDAKGELLKPDKPFNFWPANSITVIISDWRLLYPDSNDWQALQGIDILEIAHENYSNFASFFVLTGKREIVSKRPITKAPIHWFTKDDVLDSTFNFNVFAENIAREGNRIDDLLHNLPNAITWNKAYRDISIQPFKYYYKLHRVSSDYTFHEHEINRKTQDFISNPQKGIDLGNLDHFANGVDEQVVFRKKLLARRIAIGLHLKGVSEKTIYDFLILKKDNNQNNMSNYQEYFTHTLALSEDLKVLTSDYLLVEEKAFLEKDPLKTLEKSFLSYLEKILERVISNANADLEKKDAGLKIGLFNLSNINDVKKYIEKINADINMLGDSLSRKHHTELKKAIKMVIEVQKYQDFVKKAQLHQVYERIFNQPANR